MFIKSNVKFTLAILILIIIVCILARKLIIEGFHYQPYLLELGYPTRIYNPTRNMSYDLRCEPHIPKRNYYHMGSSIEPHYYNKCINIS